MKPRPTILGLMLVIAFIAVGLAALRSNDERWAALIFALTVSALCTATLVALYRRGAWAGFAVFGWAQFFMCQPYTLPRGELPALPVETPSLSVEFAYRLLRCANTPTSLEDPPREHIGRGIGLDHEGELVLLVPLLRSGALSGWVSVHRLRTGLCLTSIMIGFVGSIVGGFVALCCVIRPHSLDDERPRLTPPP